MAEKRERMLLDGKPVTVLGKGAKRGTLKVRNAYGFTEDVAKRKLKKMPENDDRRTFTVGVPED